MRQLLAALGLSCVSLERNCPPLVLSFIPTCLINEDFPDQSKSWRRLTDEESCGLGVTVCLRSQMPYVGCQSFPQSF